MISLTTAYDPGSKDEGKSYTHVNIVAAHLDPINRFIKCYWQYGYMIEEEFTPGLESVSSVNISDADYDTIDAYVSQTNEKCLESFERALTQYLLDKGIVSTGTVVKSG